MHPYTGTLKKWQKVALLLCGVDYLSVMAAYFLALYMRYDFVFADIGKEYYRTFVKTSPYYAWFVIFVYVVLKLYNRTWRFVGYDELLRCILASIFTCLSYCAFISFTVGRMPISYYLFGGILQALFLVGSRFSYRFLCLVKERYFRGRSTTFESAMLIGAGSAGHLVLRDLSTTNECAIRFKCIIDDDQNKWGAFWRACQSSAAGRE